MISYQKNNLVSIIGGQDVINTQMYSKLNILTKEFLDEELLVFDKKVLLLKFISKALNKAGIPNPVNLNKLITLYSSPNSELEYLNYSSLFDFVNTLQKIIEKNSSTFFILFLSKAILEQKRAFYINNFSSPAEIMFTLSYNDSNSSKKSKLLYESLKNKNEIILEVSKSLFEEMNFVDKNEINSLLKKEGLDEDEDILNKFIFLTKNISSISSHFDRTLITFITELLKEIKKIDIILSSFLIKETKFEKFFSFLNNKKIKNEIIKISKEDSLKGGIISIKTDYDTCKKSSIIEKTYSLNNENFNQENIKKYGSLTNKELNEFNFYSDPISYDNKLFYNIAFEQIKNFFKKSRLRYLSSMIIEQDKDFYLAELKEASSRDFDSITNSLEHMKKSNGEISFEAIEKTFEVNYVINGNPNNTKEIFAIMNKSLNAFSEFDDEDDDEDGVVGSIEDLEGQLSGEQFKTKSATKSATKSK